MTRSCVWRAGADNAPAPIPSSGNPAAAEKQLFAPCARRAGRKAYRYRPSISSKPSVVSVPRSLAGSWPRLPWWWPGRRRVRPLSNVSTAR